MSGEKTEFSDCRTDSDRGVIRKNGCLPGKAEGGKRKSLTPSMGPPGSLVHDFGARGRLRFLVGVKNDTESLVKSQQKKKHVVRRRQNWRMASRKQEPCGG